VGFKFFVGSAVGLNQHFTFISHGVGWKRGAILQRFVKAKTRKRREDAPFFAVLIADWGLWGWWVRRASTISLRRLGAGQCLGRLGGGWGRRSGVAAAATVLAV